MVADIGAALAKVFGGLRERDRAELLDALSLQRGVLDRYPDALRRPGASVRGGSFHRHCLQPWRMRRG